jgi:hypothetical protein
MAPAQDARAFSLPLACHNGVMTRCLCCYDKAFVNLRGQTSRILAFVTKASVTCVEAVSERRHNDEALP